MRVAAVQACRHYVLLRNVCLVSGQIPGFVKFSVMQCIELHGGARPLSKSFRFIRVRACFVLPACTCLHARGVLYRVIKIVRACLFPFSPLCRPPLLFGLERFKIISQGSPLVSSFRSSSASSPSSSLVNSSICLEIPCELFCEDSCKLSGGF